MTDYQPPPSSVSIFARDNKTGFFSNAKGIDLTLQLFLTGRNALAPPCLSFILHKTAVFIKPVWFLLQEINIKGKSRGKKNQISLCSSLHMDSTELILRM